MKKEDGFKNKKTGFTIVELLTVMAVIMILMSLLVPALSSLRIYALRVKQRNQFRGMDVALEFFYNERDGYPDSGEFDKSPIAPSTGLLYCGAMKFAEAMVGQDLLGFNPQSKFYQLGTFDGMNPVAGIPSGPIGAVPFGNDLYPGRPDGRVTSQGKVQASMKERNKLYLPLENANVYKLGDLYDVGLVNMYFQGSATPLYPAASLPVLCDVYPTVMHRQTGKNVGMPILYYRANTTKNSHDFTPAMIDLIYKRQLNDNIYNFMDNERLVEMGLPSEPVAPGPAPTTPQPMAYDNPKRLTEGEGPQLFYKETWNQNVPVAGKRPYRADSYILMSAGFDGLYGTKDDVFNSFGD